MIIIYLKKFTYKLDTFEFAHDLRINKVKSREIEQLL